MTSVPLKVQWGTQETDMRLVGGLLAVTQDQETWTVEPECGWVIAYDNPVDEPSDSNEWLEEQTLPQSKQDGPVEKS